MKYLIDTNIFLWFALNDKRIPEDFKKIISDRENTILVSIASLWEIIIKNSIGKVKFDKDADLFLEEMIERYEFDILNIQKNHVYQLKRLPLLHRDPFDRIIIAQAKFENINFIYANENIAKYFND